MPLAAKFSILKTHFFREIEWAYVPYAVETTGGRNSIISRTMSAKNVFENGDLGHLKGDMTAVVCHVNGRRRLFRW
jgi:hypothetical protein